MAAQIVICLNMKKMDSGFKRFYFKWGLVMSMVQLIFLFSLLFPHSYHHFWLFLSFLMFCIYLGISQKTTPRLPLLIGYPNIVTALRLVIIVVFTWYHGEMSSLSLLIGFGIAISLDGLDGYLARKFNQTTEQGANFDMEVDAFLVLALSWIHYKSGSLHWWILIPGGFRYINELTLKLLKPGQPEFFPKWLRATIAVSFFVTLLLPIISNLQIFKYLAYSSGGLILLSFCSSTIVNLNFKRN